MQASIRATRPIELYTPFFKSRNPKRNEEFLSCLECNARNPMIERIYLLVDDGHLPDFSSNKVHILRLGNRPTYQDWLRLALRKSAGCIAVLANTDIHFDETIGNLKKLLAEPLRFVALSRYDMVGAGFELHKNPEWSQDTWALAVPDRPDEALIKALDFPLGVPRCDGKVAYTFLLHGYSLHNPCRHVKSYHLHDTPVREYSRKGDRTILGGVAYLHPTEDLLGPSKVEVHIWGCNHSQISRVVLNHSIEKWAQAGVIDLPNSFLPRIGCLWLDADKKGVAGAVLALKAMRRPSKHPVRLMIERGAGWEETEKAEILESVSASDRKSWFTKIEFSESCGQGSGEGGKWVSFFDRTERLLDSVRGLGAILRYETDSLPMKSDWLDTLNRRLQEPEYHNVVLVSERSGGLRPGSPPSPDALGNLILCAGNPAFLKFLENWKLTAILRPESGTDPFGNWKTVRIPSLQGLPDGLASFGVEPLTLRMLCPLEPETLILRAPDAAASEEIWRSVAKWKQSGVVIYDRDWQFPAVTEKHASEKAAASLKVPEGHIYFGFPWATLIDLLLWNKKDSGPLSEVLATYRRLLRGSRRVVTVCQHIHMLRFQELFVDAGITDVFWSHAVKGGHRFPDHPHVRIHPFPLFPVQCSKLDWGMAARTLLFSFVGVRSGKSYLTRSRDHIIDLLADNPRGLVKGRDEWHYNKVVYDFQIRKRAASGDGLVCDDASAEFLQILHKSVFSLCPSGSGPNSIRLWESIGAGAIPVILADTYRPPGDSRLWEDAAVFCAETEEAISALPARLAAIAGDATELEKKRHAMKRLWKKYGPERFVHDIQRLFQKCEEDMNSMEMEAAKDATVEAAVGGIPAALEDGGRQNGDSESRSEATGPTALHLPAGDINIIGFSITGFGDATSIGALLHSKLKTQGWGGQVREISYGGLSINALAGLIEDASKPIHPGDVILLEIATSFFSQQKYSLDHARPYVFAIAEYFARQGRHQVAFLNLFRADLDDNDCVVQAIREAAGYFGMPVIDLKPQFRNLYPHEPWGTTDGVHPDPASREQIAEEIYRNLKTSMIQTAKPRQWNGPRYHFASAIDFAPGKERFMYSGRGKSMNSVILRELEGMEFRFDAPIEIEGVFFLYGPETGYLSASVDDGDFFEFPTFDTFSYYRRIGFRHLKRKVNCLRLRVPAGKPQVELRRQTTLECGPRSEFVCGFLIRKTPGDSGAAEGQR